MVLTFIVSRDIHITQLVSFYCSLPTYLTVFTSKFPFPVFLILSLCLRHIMFILPEVTRLLYMAMLILLNSLFPPSPPLVSQTLFFQENYLLVSLCPSFLCLALFKWKIQCSLSLYDWFMSHKIVSFRCFYFLTDVSFILYV